MNPHSQQNGFEVAILRITRFETDVATSIDESNGLSEDTAVRLSVGQVHSFLDHAIDDDVDIIVSTLRKGSWIIEDYRRIRQLRIRHVSMGEVREADIRGKNVILFDDSIHTGKSLCKPSVVVKGASKLKILSLAINNDAVMGLKEVYGMDADIESMKVFERYVEYNGNGELVKTCQAYFYAYSIVPYIENLTVSYSPDFPSLSIVVSGSSQDMMRDLAETVIDSIPGNGPPATISRGRNSYRLAKELDDRQVASLVKGLDVDFDNDMQKIRVSVSIYSTVSEIVITPIICPRSRGFSEMDARALPATLSTRFIESCCHGVWTALKENGYEVIDSTMVTGAIRDLPYTKGAADE